jgi:glucosylceramidase
MEKLFHPENGIGLSVLRNLMGASYHTRGFYSYNDIPKEETDFELERFSINHDKEDIIPLLKEAIDHNSEFSFLNLHGVRKV